MDKKNFPHSREEEVKDVRHELDKLEKMIDELKIQFEQYFMSILPLAPDKLHGDVRRKIRQLTKAPFKNSEMNFRLRALKGRYQTHHTYWQRVLKQREEGTYSRDVFKAEMRQRHAQEDAHSQTAQGAAERSLVQLFNTYKNALEQQTGNKQNIDFKAFQKSLVKRAKDFKQQHGAKKLAFKVVVKDGKVAVQAMVKE